MESVIPKFSDMVFKRNCTVVFCVFLRACFFVGSIILERYYRY